MRVFVTGASGWVGSEVVQGLLKSGHEVVGMVRSDEGAAKVKAMGAQPLRGDLNDLESLKKSAREADAIIHTAFVHDFAQFAENCAIDERAIKALGEAIKGTGKKMLVTSGNALLKPGQLSTEDMIAPPPQIVPRVSEQTAIAIEGVRAGIVRLPPTVHGTGDHGFIPIVIGMDKTANVSAYVGEGQNRWPAVHVKDAAQVYVRAIEKDFKHGQAFHAVAEEGIAFKQIAESIGKRYNLKAASVKDAQAHFGWFLHFASIDCPSSSKWTREYLDWSPKEIGLLKDIEENY